MAEQNKYTHFRNDFMQLMRRFDSMAPTLVRSGAASSAVALRSGRVVSLLDQALPDDDCGALTDQDYRVLDMAMARASELMDVLAPVAATTEVRPARFDDRAFARSLQGVDTSEMADILSMVSLAPGGGKGKKEALDVICKVIEGFDDIFEGSIFEIIKKILIIILQVLAGRTILPKKVIDLIPGLFKFIDDIIGGDTPVPPDGGDPPVTPDGGGFPNKALGIVLKLDHQVPQEFDLPAGCSAVVVFITYDGPQGTGRVDVDQMPAVGIGESLRLNQATNPIVGPTRIRVNLVGLPTTTGCVRINFF